MNCIIKEIRTERAKPVNPKLLPRKIIKIDKVTKRKSVPMKTGLLFPLPNNLAPIMVLAVDGIIPKIIICAALIELTKLGKKEVTKFGITKKMTTEQITAVIKLITTILPLSIPTASLGRRNWFTLTGSNDKNKKN